MQEKHEKWHFKKIEMDFLKLCKHFKLISYEMFVDDTSRNKRNINMCQYKMTLMLLCAFF